MQPNASRMWLAYAVAPAIAPVSFVFLFYALAITCSALGMYFNPASAVILPRLAMTSGLQASYLIAGLIGMPIAFALRHYRLLNFYTVHFAAFVWCCVFAAISPNLVGGDGEPAGQAWQWFLYVFSLTALPILLSATVFWLLTRTCRDQ